MIKRLDSFPVYSKIYLLFLIFVSLFLNPFISKSQTNQANKSGRVIANIVINGKTISDKQFDNLVIASDDTISFSLKQYSESARNHGVRYKITILNSLNSSTYVKLQQPIVYSTLPEDNYLFSVEAYNTQDASLLGVDSLHFKVNNNEASLIKEIVNLKSQITKSDTTQKKVMIKSDVNNSSNWLYLVYGFIACCLFIGLIFAILKFTKFSKLKFTKGMDGETIVSVPKSNYDKLVAENSNLKAEISALRGQIDAMSSRSNDLYKQNQDLKESVDKLSKSKIEIEELQSQKDDLFALIIHDIKNPAALIKSLVELLRSYDLTATEQQEVINDIFETTTKIVSLSQEVSRILSLESSAMILNLEDVDIEDVLKDVSRRNGIAATNKSIDVLLDIIPDLPKIRIDVQKMDEVVDNLISNAIKFSQKGSKVRISAKYENNSLVVEVSDNGLGLSEDDITKAFQRGSRLSAQPTGGEHSSGFGLWVVKKLVEAHKGRVWVKSSLGKGSTFAFSIPVIPKEKK